MHAGTVRLMGQNPYRQGTIRRTQAPEAPMISLRLVLDTNIVVSAALKPVGLQRTAILLALAKPARAYISSRFSKNTVPY
jgi:hypothetical protein